MLHVACARIGGPLTRSVPILRQAERSLHDALCVVRCLVQKRFLIAGGGAPEALVNYRLSQWAKTLVVGGCSRAYVEIRDACSECALANYHLSQCSMMFRVGGSLRWLLRSHFKLPF